MAAPEAGTFIAAAGGSLRKRRLSLDAQARLWAHALHAGADGLVEVAAGRRRADGSLAMRSRAAADHFPAAGDRGALVRLVRRHRERGEEVFCTPLTRRRPRSGKAGEVLPGRIVWVDIDQSARLERLRSFPHRPHLVVYSGSGGAHAYWLLADRLRPEAVEEANRKLAHRLGADLAVTDRARIMRVPGSFNHKAGRACRLAFCDPARAPIPADRLVAGLTDPDPPPPPPSAADRRRHAAMIASNEAAQVTSPAYYRDLDSFHREDPRRGRSRQSDFGVWHGEGATLRSIWLEQTGELYGLTLTGSDAGRVRLLASLPPSGHPYPRRSDLIAEAALAGWAERSGRPRSLAWLERRLGEVRQARLEPIDWTVVCANPGCPRH